MARRAALDRECDDSPPLSPIGSSVRCGHLLDRQPINVELFAIENRLGHDRTIRVDEYRPPQRTEYEHENRGLQPPLTCHP